jgi:3-phosphoshikimate 1-carboxyvinyltransferase
MLIKPALSLKGDITLPGDKSISHRAAMISALAEGRSTIRNYAASADCASTIKCLSELGVSITREGETVVVAGVGRQGLITPAKPLDCGNSGTTMRLVTGILSGQNVICEVTGDESLSKRPMKRVIDPVNLMGARVSSVDGHAPLRIRGSLHLTGTEHRLQIASAQIKSCILLAGLNAVGTTRVFEPAQTRDHTERMLRWFGTEVESNGPEISIRGGQELAARDMIVPGDVSASAFFLVAAASLPGSELTIRHIGLNPTRTGIIDILSTMGVDIKIADRRQECNEPVGDLVVQSSPSRIGHHDNLISGDLIANVIDEIPILAVLGTQLEGGLEVRNASELRVKESDRIASVVEGLRRMGAKVDEFPDGFRVYRSELKGGPIDSFDDHRIAMAFSIAGLLANGDTYIYGAECVNISFPGFYEVLESVAVRSEASA